MATCGAEINALKLAVERAVTIQCHLRAMRIRFDKPTTKFCDNKAVATNTTTAGSILIKKHLALAHPFCREHFSAEVVDIRWVEKTQHFRCYDKGSHHWGVPEPYKQDND